MPSSCTVKRISIGGRDSPLSRAQVEEIARELYAYHPQIILEPILLKTTGDKDLKTSLRTMGHTDFFTREIDALQLQGGCRLSAHSAKDLPIPLPKGLVLAALTKGVDPSDSLVFRNGDSLQTLPPGAVIATSSVRREETVRLLRSDLNFTDIRGTIGQRLAKLFSREVDGVVIAEAALIRLQLTSLHRLKLPGETAHFQGQLAILAREDDQEMLHLLQCIDSRHQRTTLYLGLDPSGYVCRGPLIHYPVIQTVARSAHDISCQKALIAFSHTTHLIFTSKTAVSAWLALLNVQQRSALAGKQLVAVGKATAEALQQQGYTPSIVAQEESSEGIVKALEQHDLSHSFFLWPHSSLSRRIISDYLTSRKIPFIECDLYDTVHQHPEPIPRLEHIDEIAFTSPSTVDGFLKIFSSIPRNKLLFCQGPVTRRHLDRC